ncbi:MAG: ATP synthase epsilon chain [Chloroflexi bacterium ADurb.Bin325]|nr:MAG: ATP synthase epsilon chain [Chloroflexi bacterium ADurb.Bin325]
MATMRLEFVAQDHSVFSGDVTAVQAPGAEGQLGILPKHAPLMTVLSPGEVVVQREGAEPLYFAVSGGWMEVRPDQVTILARTAERSDQIDAARAEAARARAAQLLAQGIRRDQRALVELSLKRQIVRLRVSGRRRGWYGPTASESDTQTKIE